MWRHTVLRKVVQSVTLRSVPRFVVFGAACLQHFGETNPLSPHIKHALYYSTGRNQNSGFASYLSSACELGWPEVKYKLKLWFHQSVGLSLLISQTCTRDRSVRITWSPSERETQELPRGTARVSTNTPTRGVNPEYARENEINK